MKALILVGGFGTRLRPLTLTKPKPLVEFCNKPMVMHQLEALAKVGVKEVILAVNYQPNVMKEGLSAIEQKLGIKIICSQEEEPLGTAGPLKLAEKHIDDGEPFFVFNSDITCDYPLQRFLDFHKSHKKEGTIMVTKVEEPSKYGVIVHDAEGKIQHFVEKPQTWVGNHINAGLYIFNPSILKRIPLEPTSIEKDIFPKMADEEQLYAMDLKGYWMDIGQPKDYIKGMSYHLKSLRSVDPESLSTKPCVTGNCIIDESASIGENCKIGPEVVIGPNVKIGDGVRVQRSTVLANVHIGNYCWVQDSIIGWNSSIGDWCRVEGSAVLGEDVSMQTGVAINGAIILPHKGIKDSIFEAGKIVM